MKCFYHNINILDMDTSANIYIKIIDEIKTIFTIIPYNKINGPPNEFSFFKKIYQYIFNIIELFDGDEVYYNNIKYNYDKNNNYLISTLESIISFKYQLSDTENFIKKCCHLSNIIEDLYTICYFFQFKNDFISFSNFNYKSNQYQKIFTNSNEYYLIQNNCVSYFDYLQFVLDNGYTTQKYWSYNGNKWLKKYPKNIPYFWKYNDGIWYLKYFDKYIQISNISYLPVQNISYYEAEAYCNYKNVKLIKSKHYDLISSKTYSHLFNFSNVWEWTESTNDTSICYGGSFHNKLVIKNINDLKIINKSAQHYFTGFRTIKT